MLKLRIIDKVIKSELAQMRKCKTLSQNKKVQLSHVARVFHDI